MSNQERILFFELLQIALGNRDKLSRVPKSKEWMALYQESEKQSVLGIMLDGLEQLPEAGNSKFPNPHRGFLMYSTYRMPDHRMYR